MDNNQIIRVDIPELVYKGSNPYNANAKEEDVLLGKTFYAGSYEIKTGTLDLSEYEKKLPEQTKEITPTIEPQDVVADDGYKLIKVIVDGVTSDVDPNIIPENIKLGVTILGVEGNVAPDKPDQTKTVTPTKEQQIVRADTGFELGECIVEPIPSQYEDVTEEVQEQNIIVADIEDVLAGQDVGLYDTTNSTAVETDLLEGKVAYNGSGKITGTIKTYSGDVEITPTEQDQVLSTNSKFINNNITVKAIPSNYEDVTAEVKAQNILVENIQKIMQGMGEDVYYTGDATATAETIKKGNIAYISGGKVTGTYTPNLQEKEVTENGVVTYDEGYDGLSKVTVNVGGSATDVDALMAGNLFSYLTETMLEQIMTGNYILMEGE